MPTMMILVKIKLHSFTEKYEQEEEEQNFGGKRGRGMYRNCQPNKTPSHGEKNIICEYLLP